MAARKRKYQTEKTREKIKATCIANRLQQFVLGEKDNFDRDVEMTTAQVQAAKTLLDRVVPVLRESDVTQHVEEISPNEQFQRLSETIGEEAANKLFPDMAAKIQGHEVPGVQ